MPQKPLPAPERATLPIASLVGADYNPRTWKAKARKGLRASLKRFGQVQDIVVNRRPDGELRIVGGHMRIGELLALGAVDALCTIVQLDDVEERALNLALNNEAIAGEWDQAKLDELLAQVRARDGGLFADLNLDALLREADDLLRRAAPLVDPDAIPEPDPLPPTNRKGDLWLLGRHRLLCGDSTSEDGCARLFAGKRIECLFTDPPYCSGGFQETGKAAGSIGTLRKDKVTGTRKATPKIANDQLSTRGYQALMRRVFERWAPITSYVWSDWRMWIPLYDVVEASGLGVRNMICWNKGSAGMGVGWRTQHELMMFAGSCKFDPHKALGNVITARRSGNALHPTQKPVDVIVQVLELMDMVRVIGDAFGGSGTTIAAAEQTGHEVLAAELDRKFCDTIIRRWEGISGREAVLDGDGRTFTEVAGARAAEVGATA